jgi:dynamin 1-like protein
VLCGAGDILLEKRYDGMSAADAHLARISDHVSAYLQIVRSQLLATVPKAVVHCTVVPAKDNLLAELQEEVAGAALLWLLVCW